MQSHHPTKEELMKSMYVAPSVFHFFYFNCGIDSFIESRISARWVDMRALNQHHQTTVWIISNNKEHNLENKKLKSWAYIQSLSIPCSSERSSTSLANCVIKIKIIKLKATFMDDHILNKLKSLWSMDPRLLNIPILWHWKNHFLHELTRVTNTSNFCRILQMIGEEKNNKTSPFSLQIRPNLNLVAQSTFLNLNMLNVTNEQTVKV